MNSTENLELVMEGLIQEYEDTAIAEAAANNADYIAMDLVPFMVRRLNTDPLANLEDAIAIAHKVHAYLYQIDYFNQEPVDLPL